MAGCWEALPLWGDNGLTHWGRVAHICVSKLIIISSDNGLSPGRRQAIIWTNDGILLIGAVGTNFSEILIEIPTFLFWKIHLKGSSAKWWPFCLSPNELRDLCLPVAKTDALLHEAADERLYYSARIIFSLIHTHTFIFHHAVMDYFA